MNDLYEIIKKGKGKKLMAIFPHPDDETYVSGYLLQFAKRFGVKTHLVCLTKGGKGKNSYKKGELKELRTIELKKVAEIFKIDTLSLWDYEDASLKKSHRKWSNELKKLIEIEKPFIVISFDCKGMTGHPDHIASSMHVHRIIKNLKEKPLLFWGINKRKIFYCDLNPTHHVNSNIIYILNSIRSFITHKSQIQNFSYFISHLNIIIKRKEYYFLVDPNRIYEYIYKQYYID